MLSLRFSGVILLSMLFFSSGYTADNALINALNNYNQTKTVTAPNFNLQNFSSCDEVSSVLTNFIKENAEYFKSRAYPMPYAVDMAMSDSIRPASAKMASESVLSNSFAGGSTTVGGVQSSTRDFSTTNNQVAGIDEPDILKTNGKYFFYVNERTRAIDVIQSPLNSNDGLINLSNAKLINDLKIPTSFYNTQLFLKGDTLIVVGNRYREQSGKPGFLDTNNRITVLMFDVKDPSKPQFISLKDLAGTVNDMRLMNDKLIIVHSLWSNRGRAYDYRNRGMKLDTTLVLPSTIDVSKSQNTSMTIGQTSYPFTKSIVQPACNAISYALPDTQTLKHYNLDPNFTLITTLNIKNPDEAIKQQVTIGNTQTIHVSSTAIYLAQPIYSPSSYACPMNARCMMPRFNAGQQTLLHKFGLTKGIHYTASNIIQGSPLNQYSMSEDENGNFRLLTTEWQEQQSTHLFTLDENLNPLGKLMNIEPGENFQSSRFIDDKLYLVTVQQIDPLFVIDLKDNKSPVILGELKIPGYSTYLHPWGAMKNGVQYLLGLGYDTGTGSRGGTVNSGIKVDLYKIDYNNITNKQVAIQQAYTKTLGGMESQTEATYNPRIFVWDDSRKQLILPLSLTKSEKTQQCSINYDAQGKEIAKQCYPQDLNKVIFAGTKLFSITPESGIIEKLSFDFQSILKKDPQYINQYNQEVSPRQLTSYMTRVGYAGDVMFTINQLFGHFSLMNGSNETTIELNK